MRFVCKQCNIAISIYDYDGGMKHIEEKHGKDKCHDYAWKVRNLALEMDDGKLYDCK